MGGWSAFSRAPPVPPPVSWAGAGLRSTPGVAAHAGPIALHPRVLGVSPLP